MSKKTKDAVHPVSGLKIRRQTADAVKVVNKPRKMNLVKPKRQAEKTLDMANSSLLVFPTDRFGITAELKASMIRAASKVGTDKEALKLIDDTLRILRGHVQARYNQNVNKPVLKQRVVTRVVEEPEVAEDDSGTAETTEVTYADMLAAVLKAKVELPSRKTEDVARAYAELTAEGVGEE